MAEHGRSRENEAEIRDIAKLSKLSPQHCAATALGEGFAQSREGLGVALRRAGNAISTDLTPHSRWTRDPPYSCSAGEKQQSLGRHLRSLQEPGTHSKGGKAAGIFKSREQNGFYKSFYYCGCDGRYFPQQWIPQKTYLHLILVHLCSFHRQGNNCRKLSFCDMSYHRSHSLWKVFLKAAEPDNFWIKRIRQQKIPKSFCWAKEVLKKGMFTIS